METLIQNTLNSTIVTQEENELPVTIDYDYYKGSAGDWAVSIVVTHFDFVVHGKTETPLCIITEIVRELISGNHHGLRVEFEL